MKPPLLAMTCIDDSAGFRALEREWRVLHAACPEATSFNSWEWLFSWWQAYGEGRPLRLLCWRLEGSLAGVVPLYLASEKSALGTRARVLRMVGDGSGDSDYLDFLAQPALLPTVVEQLGRWLAARGDWHALAMRDLPEHSSVPSALQGLAERQDFLFRLAQGRCAAVKLPSSLDAFLAARQPRFRTKLRALLKRLDQGAYAFETEVRPAQLRTKLRSLYALHQARWADAGGTGVFGDRRKRLFYAHFAARFARRGWLRLYSLRQGETYRAHQLCFGGKGVTYLLQEGFDVASPAESCGQLLRAAVIRHLIAHGERSYDFLGGYSRHKQDWGAEPAATAGVVVAARRWRARVYADAPLWRERAAGAAHWLLPKSAVRMLKHATTVVP